MATIEARITKVDHDVSTGWYTISTDHDSVKKLTTKMEPKAQEAAALRQSGEVALIEYSPKQRTDQASGRTYNNNYYESARTAVPSSNGGSSGIDTVASAAGSRKTDPDDAWRMAKTSGSYHAVATLPLMPTEQRDFETQKRIALAWAQWIMEAPRSGSEAPTPATTSTYGEPPDFESPPPPMDDDIPY